MGQERLVGLTSLNVHSDVKIHLDTIIDKFQSNVKEKILSNSNH